MKKMTLLFTALASMLFLTSAFAADSAAPDFSLTIIALMEAIKNHGSVAVILVAVFQLLRTAPVVGVLGSVTGKYLQVIIAVSTALGYIAVAAAQGNLGLVAGRQIHRREALLGRCVRRGVSLAVRHGARPPRR